jgi:hypothetical protein
MSNARGMVKMMAPRKVVDETTRDAVAHMPMRTPSSPSSCSNERGLCGGRRRRFEEFEARRTRRQRGRGYWESLDV